MNNTNFSDDWLTFIPTITYSTTNHSNEIPQIIPPNVSIITFFLRHFVTCITFLMCHHSDSLQLFNNFYYPKTQLFKFRETGLALFHYLKGAKMALFQKRSVSKSHHAQMQLFSIAFSKHQKISHKYSV